MAPDRKVSGSTPEPRLLPTELSKWSTEKRWNGSDFAFAGFELVVPSWLLVECKRLALLQLVCLQLTNPDLCPAFILSISFGDQWRLRSNGTRRRNCTDGAAADFITQRVPKIASVSSNIPDVTTFWNSPFLLSSAGRLPVDGSAFLHRSAPLRFAYSDTGMNRQRVVSLTHFFRHPFSLNGR